MDCYRLGTMLHPDIQKEKEAMNKLTKNIYWRDFSVHEETNNG